MSEVWTRCEVPINLADTGPSSVNGWRYKDTDLMLCFDQNMYRGKKGDSYGISFKGGVLLMVRNHAQATYVLNQMAPMLIELATAGVEGRSPDPEKADPDLGRTLQANKEFESYQQYLKRHSGDFEKVNRLSKEAAVAAKKRREQCQSNESTQDEES